VFNGSILLRSARCLSVTVPESGGAFSFTKLSHMVRMKSALPLLLSPHETSQPGPNAVGVHCARDGFRLGRVACVAIVRPDHYLAADCREFAPRDWSRRPLPPGRIRREQELATTAANDGNRFRAVQLHPASRLIRPHKEWCEVRARRRGKRFQPRPRAADLDRSVTLLESTAILARQPFVAESGEHAVLVRGLLVDALGLERTIDERVARGLRLS
jgi:hypothetical protein